MVTIEFNLTLIKLAGKEQLYIYLEEPKKLTDVLNDINVPSEVVGMVIRNKRWTPIDCIIEENDELQIFPHLEGG